jgi:septal ring factor EnvC (AmiA/AmiB activator)
MKKPFTLIIAGCAMIIGSFVGCSSKPSDEEMQQLNDLKAQVASLEKGITARESEKTDLLKSIADKDAQIAQCAKDKDTLQMRLQSLK